MENKSLGVSLYQNNCPICLEEIDCDKKAIELHCGHFFHRDCIKDIKGNSCPLCRGNLTIKDIHDTIINI